MKGITKTDINHKFEFEKNILSDLILNSKKAGKEYFRIDSLHFTPLTQKIFNAIKTLYQQNIQDKKKILYELLKKFPENKDLILELSTNSNYSYFSKITTLNNAKYFLDCICDIKEKEIIKEYNENKINYHEANLQISDFINSLPNFFNIRQSETFTEYLERKMNPEHLPYYSKQFPFIRDSFGTIEAGNIITISAKSSVGKSFMALQLLIDLCETNKINGAYFSLEMPTTEIIERALCSRFNIDSMSIRTGEYYRNLSKPDKEILIDYADYLQNKVKIYDEYFSILDIQNKTSELKSNDDNIRIIVIDFVNSVKLPRKGENRYHELREIMEYLKRLALQLKIIIIVLAQNNRNNEIGDSFTIYQYSDFLISLSKPIKEPEFAKEKTIVINSNVYDITNNLIVAMILKSRHTEANNTEIVFNIIKSVLTQMDNNVENLYNEDTIF
ncbi:MAG TPA: DnaB-like helicase C-terminal domain-containing protein [Melioribacteraceae bacterium]|nr:DnaB-like helicase C-terminal domain-containing protein [Melioribacteraceae bacterium]